MPLASLHACMGVVAADSGRFLDRPDRLGIHDGRARMRFLAVSLAFSDPQGAEEAQPETRTLEAFEMIVDRLPWWETARQVLPGTPGTQEVEDRIENRAE